MDFWHENSILAYFAFLGELSLGLFLANGLFGNFSFLSLLAGFSTEQKRHSSQQVL